LDRTVCFGFASTFERSSDMNMGSGTERAMEFCRKQKPDLGKTIDNLARLNRFRQVGQNRYVACCPAHDDKNPSLSITQISDKVLVHCFAGCKQRDVLQALTELGLWNRKFQDLHPEPHERYSRDELEFMDNCCLIAKFRKRKGEPPAAEKCKVFYHRSAVPKPHLPKSKPLFSGGPR